MLPLSRLRESPEETAETWTALRDLGVFDISMPEDQGGSGLGMIEEALIAIELGRRVVAPSPFDDGSGSPAFRRGRLVDTAQRPGCGRLSAHRSSRLRR